MTANIALQPVAISADGSSLLAHTDDASASASSESSGSALFSPTTPHDAQHIYTEFLDFFEIRSTAAFILRQKCTRVGLQFPDELLTHATQVLKEIRNEMEKIREEEKLMEKKENENGSAGAATSVAVSMPADAPSASAANASSSLPLFYILADTSYGSCCVDEVAAQHANCDLIVHYGFSCLSRTRRMPVRYVFGRKKVDAEAMCKKVFDDSLWMPEAADSSSSSSFSFSSTPSSSQPAVDAATLPPLAFIILYNLEYSHLMNEDSEFILKVRVYLEKKNEGRRYVITFARVQQEQERGSEHAVKSECLKEECKNDSSAAASSSNCCSSSSSAPASSCCSSSSSAASCSINTALSSSASTSSTAAAPSSTSSSNSSLPPLLFTSSNYTLSSDDPLISLQLNGYIFSLPTSFTSATSYSTQQTQFIWIGSDLEYKLLTNSMLIYNTSSFHSYNPLTRNIRQNIKSQSRTLARRYYLMEKSKNCEIIGILVGTLGVAEYLDVILRLKKLILNAGKKSYLFVVGKLNEPKLGNFGEIDLFVLVACPLNTMFDSTGYYRDVVTPYELFVALTGKEWTGEYQTGFGAIMQGVKEDGKTKAAAASLSSSSAVSIDNEESGASDDLSHGMRYDPISGKMRSALPSQLYAKGIRLEREEGDEEEDDDYDEDAVPADNQLALYSQSLVRVEGGQLVQLKTASDHFLTQRSYKGLLLKHEGEEDYAVAIVEPGLSGIARNYKQTELEPPSQQITNHPNSSAISSSNQPAASASSSQSQ